MPNKADCFFLGYIGRTFGYAGELVVSLDVDDPARYADLKSVLVEVKGALVPYFIEEIKMRDRDAVWRFEGVDTEEAARLVGCELYLPLSALPPLTGNRFYFHEVVGFTVEDREAGEIGTLTRVYDNGPQPILSIEHPGGKEIMVPLIDAFLLEVDRAYRRLKIAAPEGLIDFYLA
ncbi:MAG: ribosome maturation factor RimM [Bacteroidales bacterium]|nr:ribosome maturation factor RimM [Bacteroidales bacterium]